MDEGLLMLGEMVREGKRYSTVKRVVVPGDHVGRRY